MRFADVYLVSDKRRLATEDQIAAAEAALGTRFPEGYRAYMTTLGTGYLNSLSRVLPPDEIVGQTHEFRERMHFLYEDDLAYEDDAEGDPLPLARQLECILLIDAGGGHEIVNHPDAPGDLFFLSHDQDPGEWIGRDVGEALDWFLSPERFGLTTLALTPEGAFVERPLRWFEPDRETGRAEFVLRDAAASTDVHAHLVGLAQQHPASALCVTVRYRDEEKGEGYDLLRLFDAAYSGSVECSEGSPRPDRYIRIVYDADRRDETVEALIAYCRSRAQAELTADGVMAPI